MNNKLDAAFPTLVLPEGVELSGHRYLGKKQGNCVKCSTGKILSVGFLELFLWEHVALVPGGFCGTACRAGSLYCWEQRGSSKGPRGAASGSCHTSGMVPVWSCTCLD